MGNVMNAHHTKVMASPIAASSSTANRAKGRTRVVTVDHMQGCSDRGIAAAAALDNVGAAWGRVA